MKVLLIVGTRPEAIKLAPLVLELRERHAAGRSRDLAIEVCATGQHRELVDRALELFAVTPDHDLDVMVTGQTPTHVASSVLARLEPVLAAAAPDWVLVQGDTTSAAVAALAAYYGRCRVGHVEAGLRTYDRWNPFPEEINRRMITAIADRHFAPTRTAADQLAREGIAPSSVLVTGNTVIDAVRWVSRQPPPLEHAALVGAGARRLVVVTAHRRENHGEPLREICAAIAQLAARFPDVRFVIPVHPTPAVRRGFESALGNVAGVVLCEPLGYASLVHLMKQATLVLTDSGGIQEEAPSLGVPVLVLRQVTERPEAITAGTARLVGVQCQTIVAEAARLLDDEAARLAMARAVNPYGDGNAAFRILSSLAGEDVVPFDPH